MAAVNVANILYDAVWTALETGDETPPLVLTGNRMDQRSRQHWLRERTRTAPNDFPNFTVEVGEDGTDSGFTSDEAYAQDDPDFLTQTTSSANREITESVRITVTDRVMPSPDQLRLVTLCQAIVRDIMRAAPNIAITSFVVWRVGPFTRSIRDGLGGVVPNQFPVKVATIRFNVVTLQEIRASLAV